MSAAELELASSVSIAPTRVLVADDDAELLTLLAFALRNAGFEVETASTGAAALQALKTAHYSLLLIDINMPEPGFKVCEAVRANSTIPILMLSARSQESDLVDALEAGVDAYITKPFSPRSLIARVRALLRRVSQVQANNDEALHIQVGEFRLEIDARVLHTPHSEVQLTRLEAHILHLLMLNADQTVLTRTLIDKVWSSYSNGNRNMLKQVIFRLRRKLERDPLALSSLATTNEGYRWVTTS